MSDWTPDKLCETCGKGPFKNRIGWEGHQRSKGHPSHPISKMEARQVQPNLAASVGDVYVPPTKREWWGLPASGPLAVIPDWRQATRLIVGARSITMLDPRCRICQNMDNVPLNWHWDCPHDPYITVTPKWEDVPTLQAEIGPDGQPTGRQKIAKVEKVVSYSPRPNTREITDSMRSNSGHGVEWARRKGFILPSELRSPLYPNGIAEACQFRDCKTQANLASYKNGRFCREVEAQLVWHDDTGTVLEVGEWSNEATENRKKMLAVADVR